MDPETSDTTLDGAVSAAITVLRSVLELKEAILVASQLIRDCLLNGCKILACGNGGSAADAADFTTEFTCKFAGDRRPYPAINLSQGGSLITAIANDYGFEEVFSRQVVAFGQRNDLLLAISTSGNSADVRQALWQACRCGLKTIALLGRAGGSTAGIADVDLIVRADSTARIQEAHKFILHVLCEMCEPILAANERSNSVAQPLR